MDVEKCSNAELLLAAFGEAPEEARFKHIGGLAGIFALGQSALEEIVSPDVAARIRAAVELMRRAREGRMPGRTFRSSRDVSEVFCKRIGYETTESVWMLCLDARQKVIADIKISEGGAASCHFSVSQMFRRALHEGAASVILVHNHPAGDPTPSPEDVKLTEILARCGRDLDVPLLDHVIVARDNACSFCDLGLIRHGKG